MPKIPGAAALKRDIPSIDGRIDVRGVGANIGAGLMDVAAVASQIGEREKRNQLAKANADMSVALISEANAYDQDPDYATFDERFTGNTETKLGEVAATIENEQLRNEFIQKYRPKIALSREKVRGLAWGKEKDFERGELTTRLETLRNAAILSGDIEDANTQALDLLQSHADLGHIDADDSVTIRNSFRDSLSKGYVEAQDPERRAETLKQPWAKKYLAPDVYAGLKRQADDELRIGKAQTQVDEYLDTDLDRADVMEKIDKKYSGDPKLRKEIESRFDYAFGKKKVARVEEQSALFDQYFLPIRLGEATIDSIPREDLERMSPQQQNSLYSAQKNSVSSAKVSFNIGAEDKLNYLLKTRQFPELRKFFVENAGTMSDSQNKSWSEVSIDGVMPIEVESLFTAKASIDAKTPNYTKENRAVLKDSMDTWYRGYQQRENRIPTDDEVGKQIDRMILEYDTSWWWGGAQKMFEMTEDEKTYVMERAREEDQTSFDDTAEFFRAKGVQPDHAQFMEAYTKLKDKRSGS